MAETSGAKFLEGSLFRHVAVMSFTSSIGIMAIFAVDFIDMIFISMLGNAALAAAVGYAGTLLFFSSSIAIGMSIAAGVLVARQLGADDRAAAARSAGNVAVLSAIFGVLLAIPIVIFAPNLLALLGAEGEALDLAVTYIRILTPSLPIMMIAFVANSALRAHGDAKRAMYATLGGGIVNAILDPIFIFGLDLDLAGAAMASVASRFTICALSLAPLIARYQGIIKPDFTSVRDQATEISALATPAVLANIATPVGSAFITRASASFGDDVVGAIAIINRLTPVAFAVVFALSGAIGPIIGQNAGAGKLDRVKGAFRDAVIFLTIYVLIIAVALFFLRAPIASLFELNETQTRLVHLFCGPIALSYIFVGVIFVANASFNNLGHPYYSTWINWGRNTIGTILPIWGAMAIWGADGILIGQAIGAAIFAAISVVLVQKISAELDPGLDAPKYNARAHVIHWRRH